MSRNVLSLPARLGGLDISLPQVETVNAHENSLRVSAPLTRLILRQELELDPREIAAQVMSLKSMRMLKRYSRGDEARIENNLREGGL